MKYFSYARSRCDAGTDQTKTLKGMCMRRGIDYRESLLDERRVFVDGERVQDVPAHQAFKGAVETVGAMYDYAADPDNEMQYTAPETGGLALKPFMIPRSAEDLTARRNAIRRWAELTHGFMGRSPDHVGALLAGFASHSHRFDGPNGDFGPNVSAWYRRLLKESLHVTYTIVPPPTSSRPAPSLGPSEHIQVAIRSEDSQGIVVRGAQMLGTATAIADHVFVSCIKPISPDFAEYAVSFIVPVATEGLEVHCRRPYVDTRSDRDDYPLSARYDESDALVVFDDVFVPWQDVFAVHDIRLVRDQFFETPAHALANSQASRRLATKLNFMVGIANEVCELNGIIDIPAVVEKLSELSSLAAFVEGMSDAADVAATLDDAGVMVPNKRFLYALVSLQSEIYSRSIGILRELVGGGIMIVPPSSEKSKDEYVTRHLDRYFTAPGSGTDRGKLMKLAWDVLGSEFAGRHHQYETFYAGSPTVARRWAYEYYDVSDGVGAVRQFIDEELGTK